MNLSVIQGFDADKYEVLMSKCDEQDYTDFAVSSEWSKSVKNMRYYVKQKYYFLLLDNVQIGIFFGIYKETRKKEEYGAVMRFMKFPMQYFSRQAINVIEK